MNASQKRILWRILKALSVLLAAWVAGMTVGCAVHWQGLGVEFSSTPPSSSQPAAVVRPL